MRKRLIIILCCIMISTAFAGCNTADHELLSFDQGMAVQDSVMDNHLTQADFFSEHLVSVTASENEGGDQELSSGANLLVNVTDRKLLYADHVYDRLYPASLTKMMTALVVLKYAELTDDVTISYNASHIQESGAKLCGFKEGDTISMEALLKSMLIYSGNDAAVAIADYISGSEEAFSDIMNKEAKKIGAVHTNYVNSNGLHDDNHYTTAYDIYLVFNELLQYDTFRSIINMDAYTAEYKDKDGNDKEKTFKSTNQFINGEAEIPEGITIIGGKTGTTRKAGNCLAMLSKDEEGKEYISVILKADNSSMLYSQMSHLLSLIQ